MPLAQQRIGEYVLDARVGAGASGEVWRAHHHVWSNRLVAVKIATDPEHIRDLQRQEMDVKKLSHPGIVTILGFDPFNDPPYIVMEYVAGGSLRPWIARGSLSPHDAVAVTTRLLEALSHAHGQGVTHGDVKPENILINERAGDLGLGAPGMIKLTDFGLGKRQDQPDTEIVMSTSLNREGFRNLGTMDYMSPEQRHGKEIDGRSDLYACGVVLYEMLTGSKPVGMEAPTELNPSIPCELDDVFRRSCARIEKRFQFAEEFLKALNQVNFDGVRKACEPQRTAAAIAPLLRPAPPPLPPDRRGTPGIVVALLLYLFFPVGLYLLWTHRQWTDKQKWKYTIIWAAAFGGLFVLSLLLCAAMVLGRAAL
jgi:serine/threonine protein kinase